MEKETDTRYYGGFGNRFHQRECNHPFMGQWYPLTEKTRRSGFDNFYKLVNMTSCFMAGMDIDKGTQQWWQAQSPEARAAVMKTEGESILSVTRAAYCWLSALAEYDLYMWCRGIDFDLPKIEWCFRQFVEKSPTDTGLSRTSIRTRWMSHRTEVSWT